MNRRFARWTAWLLVATFFVLATAGITLQVLANSIFADLNISVLIGLMLLVGVWVVTGALIISHHPRHPVGWLLCAGLFTACIDMLAAGYASYDFFIAPVRLPGVNLALVWLKLVSLGPHGLAAFTWIALLFPDGKLLSPGWRRVAQADAAALLGFLSIQLFEPGPVDPVFLPLRMNPLAVSEATWRLLEPFYWSSLSLLILGFLAAVASLAVKLKISRGEARQQLKWLVFPAGLYAIFALLFFYGVFTGRQSVTNASVGIGQLAIAWMVVAIASAIFKFRLYDVDLIIRRTVQYASLSAVLGLFYYSVILLLQAGMNTITGQAESPLAIVLTTLLFGSLFNPLRLRIQLWIDRRFFRAKYDAEKAMSVFGEAARDEVDMNLLANRLLGVVGETMQPIKIVLMLQNQPVNKP